MADLLDFKNLGLVVCWAIGLYGCCNVLKALYIMPVHFLFCWDTKAFFEAESTSTSTGGELACAWPEDEKYYRSYCTTVKETKIGFSLEKDGARRTRQAPEDTWTDLLRKYALFASSFFLWTAVLFSFYLNNRSVKNSQRLWSQLWQLIRAKENSVKCYKIVERVNCVFTSHPFSPDFLRDWLDHR